MLVIGLIKEGKIPEDKRVALTPAQCRMLQSKVAGLKVIVQPCKNRCFSDDEYRKAGVEVNEDVSSCNLLLGIKEVPVQQLVPGKRYMFFSHTKKMQPHNQALMNAMVDKKITLIDYECLEHADGQRIIGFGFFAGIVGAHNGIYAYGNRTGAFSLCRVGECKTYKHLLNKYFGLKLPNVKIAVTGSGRVASGILEIMNLLGVIEVEKEDFLSRDFEYPAYVQLKGPDLYEHKVTRKYNRDDFHNNPRNYRCTFRQFLPHTDILMNGIYWDKNVPRLFEWSDMLLPDFRIQTIADITDDKEGSVPCNLGDSTIEFPVYGVDPISRQMVDPYQKDCVDVMAVGNLPNELPRDASRYFGQQLIKYVLEDVLQGTSPVLERATILKEGKLTPQYDYLHDYAYAPQANISR
ncbi:NAD(P)-dependent oxidoreductase [Aridibaculum aurantiacum]|uniref:NAD(P)-dependent oxidoreductase n=1 Tax=Aridibaculum aurantiacum TaxID=2810307 RepID=UPI001A9793F1|nr:NAD(P)-dependent oxidoreductase [Aridibaculum aurantiacum]